MSTVPCSWLIFYMPFMRVTHTHRLLPPDSSTRFLSQFSVFIKNFRKPILSPRRSDWGMEYKSWKAYDKNYKLM
uniref:Uncharacterized protein n=1 Tax=Rhizophora mucronata TaxID=61149 RepID=A0A2P2J0G0_RHIMU